jgi:Domain of unknown function (DUF4399)
MNTTAAAGPLSDAAAAAGATVRVAHAAAHLRLKRTHTLKGEKSMRKLTATALLAAVSLAAVPLATAQSAAAPTPAAGLPRTTSPPGAEVYIISPKNGAVVHNPVLVQFGLKGMGIAPAGVKSDNTGHHHLLIDTAAPADQSLPLPATDKIVHFGKGQTETSINLSPGQHTLQLLFADLNHIPHSPAVLSKKITITVKP